MNPLSKLCCCSSDEINWLNIFRLIDYFFGNKYVIKLLIFVYYTDYLHHLSRNTIFTTCLMFMSTSEVTTLWRYINLFIIIIITQKLGRFFDIL